LAKQPNPRQPGADVSQGEPAKAPTPEQIATAVGIAVDEILAVSDAGHVVVTVDGRKLRVPA